MFIDTTHQEGIPQLTPAERLKNNISTFNDEERFIIKKFKAGKIYDSRFKYVVIFDGYECTFDIYMLD